jgi:hypothetical protein
VDFIVYNNFTYATRTLEMREIMNVAKAKKCSTVLDF